LSEQQKAARRLVVAGMGVGGAVSYEKIVEPRKASGFGK